ncbi:MAG TPA: hypothetical protein VIV58_16040, partial [Kofleriaceae bacterium]
EPASRYQTADAVLASLEQVGAELGVFASANSVAKFMRELFAAELAEPPPRDAFAAADETTAAFSHAPTGAPRRRASTIADPLGSQTALITEYTAELQAELAAATTPDERIDMLVDRAFACHGAGEIALAITAVELALAESEGAGFLRHHGATVMAILEAYVGDPAQVPRLAGSREAILARPDLAHARAVVQLVDGHESVAELVATCGLSPLDAYRQLCALLLRGCLELG